MRYIIDVNDLYRNQDKPISIKLDDIVEIVILPYGMPLVTGRVLKVAHRHIVVDASTQFNSSIETHRFDNIMSIKVINKKEDK